MKIAFLLNTVNVNVLSLTHLLADKNKDMNEILIRLRTTRRMFSDIKASLSTSEKNDYFEHLNEVNQSLKNFLREYNTIKDNKNR